MQWSFQFPLSPDVRNQVACSSDNAWLGVAKFGDYIYIQPAVTALFKITEPPARILATIYATSPGEGGYNRTGVRIPISPLQPYNMSASLTNFWITLYVDIRPIENPPEQDPLWDISTNFLDLMQTLEVSRTKVETDKRRRWTLCYAISGVWKSTSEAPYILFAFDWKDKAGVSEDKGYFVLDFNYQSIKQQFHIVNLPPPGSLEERPLSSPVNLCALEDSGWVDLMKEV